MEREEHPNDHYITPQQLCIGLQIHLDLSWMDHPFTFSSFKIKSLDQIATLQSLGLTRIRYSPGKSEAEPLAVPTGPVSAPPPALSREHDPAYAAKRQRVERLAAQRAKVNACEREFQSATKAIKSITQNLFARPKESYEAARGLTDTMVDSMLTDADVAITLMSDKAGNEDVYYHSLNVTVLAMMLAKELKAPAEAIKSLGVGALFHDIGKVEIPDKVLRKIDPLTHAEAVLMQQHVVYGLEIGKKLELSGEVMAIVAQHHEHADGSGYPRGLQGNQISLLARIVTIVNAYDNLCNPPNPAKAMTPHEALSVMYAQQRAHFDANALSVFIRCMGVYPPGSIVVLSNETIGMVVSVNSTRPLKPTVLVYDPAVPKEEAILVDLEQEAEVSIARTLKPQQLPRPVFEYLSPRRRVTYYFDAESGGGVGG
ncbi:HD-GYP domain-containing protein [Niveibacterium sp. 24ML]|uniref:HD-GYP domain-containing protein n=1 Tax=Niveibacterium sp. 24ML TaxID=2985512 RepID=UPI00226D8448|nr:HD-GYP domain-containing protein [Niveibacterium sp. 24ML]MCX9156381.1 HD-GYP domain-containing protein [Niveibacterium sp. 24ML]